MVSADGVFLAPASRWYPEFEGAPLVRFAMDVHLPAGWSAGTVHWSSDFRISHRMVARMTLGRIALGGDAAHIHSPMGARGMNLGIEDAFVYAACAADFLAGEAGRLDDYDRIRRPVDAAVVDRVRRLTGMVRNTSPLAWAAVNAKGWKMVCFHAGPPGSVMIGAITLTNWA